jgi:hypothetical protein
MKTFKEYLAERRADAGARQSVSEKIFDVNMFTSSAVIPISTPIFNRVFGESPKVRAFHTTDIPGTKGLLRIQGSKKSISAFFVMDARNIKDGVGETEGGILVELEGSMLAGFAEDIFSSPDKTGRRWVTTGYLGDQFSVDLNTDVINMMAGIVNEIGTKYKFASDFNKNDMAKEWKKFKSNIDANPSMRGKILKDTIKLYIDGSEKILKKHSRALKVAWREYASSNFNDRSNYTKRRQAFDELLVNEFKVTRIHIPEGKKMYNDIFVHTPSGGMEARPEPNKRIMDFVKYLKGKADIKWHKDYDAIAAYVKTHAGQI